MIKRNILTTSDCTVAPDFYCKFWNYAKSAIFIAANLNIKCSPWRLSWSCWAHMKGEVGSDLGFVLLCHKVVNLVRRGNYPEILLKLL